jgi:single-strand DNA-binding protein
MSVNNVTILGNIGKDIKKSGQDSNPVANFTVATDYTYKNRDQVQVTETEWHRVVAFGQQARHLLEYASSGRQVYIEGRLKTRKWVDAQGATRYVTEIHASKIQLLGPRSERQAADVPSDHRSAPAQPATEASATATAEPCAAPAASSMGIDDDIPF